MNCKYIFVILMYNHFEYVKYFKPIGVTCTTDKRVKDNIIDANQEEISNFNNQEFNIFQVLFYGIVLWVNFLFLMMK